MLAGGGPADVVELTLALAREMLAGAGATDVDPADKLADGSAMDVVEGDDPRPGRRPGRRAAGRAGSRTTWWRPSSGVLTRLDALAVGTAAWRLGAGRSRKEDPVQAGRRRALARPAGRPGHRGAAAADAADRRAGPLRAGAGGARGRLRHRGGRVVRRRPDRDRPGGLHDPARRRGSRSSVSATRVRMGIGWDKDAGAGRRPHRRPEVDLDATALQFAGGQLFDLAFYNNLKTRDGSVEHLGDNTDRQRRGRRRGDPRRPGRGARARSTRSCSWSAATRATRWSGSPTPTAGWSTTRPTRSWRGSRSRSR